MNLIFVCVCMCIVEFFYSKREETGPASMKQNISSHRCIITLSAAVTAASRKLFSFPVLFFVFVWSVSSTRIYLRSASCIKCNSFAVFEVL